EVRERRLDKVHVLGELPVPALDVPERPPELKILGQKDRDQRLLKGVPKVGVEPLDQGHVVGVRYHRSLRRRTRNSIAPIAIAGKPLDPCSLPLILWRLNAHHDTSLVPLRRYHESARQAR